MKNEKIKPMYFFVDSEEIEIFYPTKVIGDFSCTSLLPEKYIECHCCDLNYPTRNYGYYIVSSYEATNGNIEYELLWHSLKFDDLEEEFKLYLVIAGLNK